MDETESASERSQENACYERYFFMAVGTDTPVDLEIRKLIHTPPVT